MAVPPGGFWFWQDGDHSVASPSYDVAVAQVGAALAESGSAEDPAQALLGYMAPRMPRWWSTGYDGPRKPRLSDYMEEAAKYFDRRVARVDAIDSRMRKCAECPHRTRPCCLSCHGIPRKVVEGFGGRRSLMPLDNKSGVCPFAGTFSMVIASVEYDKDEAAWPGTPPTCWRMIE